MPPGIEYWDVPIYQDLSALEDVDVIYLLRMQLERAKGKVPRCRPCASTAGSGACRSTESGRGSG